MAHHFLFSDKISPFSPQSGYKSFAGSLQIGKITNLYSNLTLIAPNTNILLCHTTDCLFGSARRSTSGQTMVKTPLSSRHSSNNIVDNSLSSNIQFVEQSITSSETSSTVFAHIDGIALKFLVFLYVLLFCFTIIGNVIVLVVVILRSKTGKPGWGMAWKGTGQWAAHRSPFLVLQISMAIADLGVGFFCIPIVLSELFYGYYPFSGVMCKIYITIQGTTRAANTWFICAIAVHRYLQATNPRLLMRHFCQKRALLAVGFIWLAGIATSLPSTLAVVVIPADYRNDQIFYCEEIWKEKIAHVLYAIFNIVVLLIFPSALLIFCYSRLIRSIRRLAIRRSNNLKFRFCKNNRAGDGNLSDGEAASFVKPKSPNNNKGRRYTYGTPETPTTAFTNLMNTTIIGDDYENIENEMMGYVQVRPSCGNIITCYRSTREYNSRAVDEMQTALMKHDRQQRRAIRLLIIISVLFIISWTPYYIINTGNIVRDAIPYHQSAPRDDVSNLFVLNIDNTSSSHGQHSQPTTSSYISETADSLNTFMVVVSYALFFGHFHSCHNAFLYLLLDAKYTKRWCSEQGSGNRKDRRASCEQMTRRLIVRGVGARSSSTPSSRESTSSSVQPQPYNGDILTRQSKMCFVSKNVHNRTTLQQSCHPVVRRPLHHHRLHFTIIEEPWTATSQYANCNPINKKQRRLKMPVDPNRLTNLYN